MGWDHINYVRETLYNIFQLNILDSRTPARKFYNEDNSNLYNLIKEMVHDERTINSFILNNDLNICAVHTFCSIYKKELLEMKLTKFHKRVIGYYINVLMESIGYEEPIRKYKGDSLIKYGKLYRIRN